MRESLFIPDYKALASLRDVIWFQFQSGNICPLNSNNLALNFSSIWEAYLRVEGITLHKLILEYAMDFPVKTWHWDYLDHTIIKCLSKYWLPFWKSPRPNSARRNWVHKHFLTLRIAIFKCSWNISKTQLFGPFSNAALTLNCAHKHERLFELPIFTNWLLDWPIKANNQVKHTGIFWALSDTDSNIPIFT